MLIAAAGSDQLLNGIRIVHRHHAAAHGVFGRVQRNRQGELQLFFGQLVDHRHKAAGGKAEIAHTDVDSIGTGNDFQKIHHIVKIVQRLADAHQHYMRNTLAGIAHNAVNFGCDLACFQIAHTAALCGCAKAAAHPAAHLRGHTHGVAIIIAHQNRFNAVSVGQLKQIFHRAVLRALAAANLVLRNIEILLQPGDERLGLIRHLGKFCCLFLVYPVKDLLGTKARLPQLFHKGCKLFDRK